MENDPSLAYYLPPACHRIFKKQALNQIGSDELYLKRKITTTFSPG